MNLIDELEREKAHSDIMKGAAEMWMRKAQEAQRTILALVEAAGGSIEVPIGTLHDLPGVQLLVTLQQPWNMSIIFKTRRVPSNKSSNNA